MEATVVRPGALSARHIAEWQAFQQSNPALGSPFLAPAFAIAVDAARDDARVAIVHDDGTIIGYLAFQTDDAGVGKPIGATMCDTQAFMCEAGATWDARRLVAATGLQSWSFDHLVAGQLPFAPFHTVLHASPVIDVTGGHADFVTSVRAQSKDLLSQVARRRRKLERDHGEVVTAWQSPEPMDDLAELMRWKSLQYEATGVWDRFAHRWITDVVTRLASSEEVGCKGVLTTTRAGGRLVAVHFGLLGPAGLSWWFPAYDPDFSPYSPGLVLLLDLVALAAERSIPRIDLGRGEHGYKLRVATGVLHVAEGAVPAA
jgi:CelD/BcsL family acetyltransferase involved in cellulose biosynthesis